MIEWIATAVITAGSVLLFGYWFRYTCLLILSAKTTRDYAASVIQANQLGFPAVQAMLRDRALSDLDGLKDSLDRDYKVLTNLLQNSGNLAESGDALEKRMLEINYRLMGAMYSATRRFSPSAALRALDEMSLVVSHFANAMGERATAGAAA
jgi:hypothetical protein